MLKVFDDGMLYSYSPVAVRRNLTEVVREHRPFAVFTHKPYIDFSLPSHEGWTDVGFHTDHQDTGRHVLDVARNAAGNARTFPDLGEAHGPAELYFWDFGTDATHFLDINASSLFERKMDALFSHRSQYANRSDMESLWANIAGMVGSRIGMPGLKTEAFTRF